MHMRGAIDGQMTHNEVQDTHYIYIHQRTAIRQPFIICPFEIMWWGSMHYIPDFKRLIWKFEKKNNVAAFHQVNCCTASKLIIIISCTDWTGQTFIFLLLSRHLTHDQRQRFVSHKKSKDLKPYGRLYTSLLLSVTFKFDLLCQWPFNGMTAVGDVTPRDGQNNINNNKKGFMDTNPPWSSISASS